MLVIFPLLIICYIPIVPASLKTNLTKQQNIVDPEDDCKSLTNHHKLSITYKESECITNTTDAGEIILSCRRGLGSKWSQNSDYEIHSLKLSEWPSKCFPLQQILHQFPQITNLSIHNASITKFTYESSLTAHHLKFLQLNYLHNWTITEEFLSHFPILEELDLCGNVYKSIHPEILSTSQNLTRVYLSNNHWNCTHEGIQWMNELNTTSSQLAISRIIDYKNLTCQGSMYPGKPLHVVMDILKTLREECPPLCSCHLTNLVRNPEGILIPVSTADCRYQSLLELPAKIPNITTIILLHGNKITDVRPLSQNLAYRRVSDVYLDDNMVSSVQPLEGADWMHTFRVFSLRGNNMTQLPAYAFDNAFQHNQNIAHVYLGKNPWRCDCHFTPRFQDLLSKYRELVADLDDITCVKTDIPEILNAQIITISRSTICRQVEETLQPIDILNVVLASLIILILGKLAYDYYCFKKTGKLPWIVSKMP